MPDAARARLAVGAILLHLSGFHAIKLYMPRLFVPFHDTRVRDRQATEPRLRGATKGHRGR